MRKRKKRQNEREEDTMAAITKNYVYEVKPADCKKVAAHPAASKSFLDDCKRVADKYRKRK